MTMITIIGRGHGGTRAMSHTLSQSSVFMGEPQNESGDLVPAERMYEACRLLAQHVRYNGHLGWDLSRVLGSPVDPRFTALIEEYLDSVLRSTAPLKGWKIPETVLVLPWIVRMFPDARYIHWVRDPRDSILGSHLTDDLEHFGIDYDQTDDVRRRRAISWKYQSNLIRATPKPHHWIMVRFEDFVLDQERTLARIEEFLGLRLARIEVWPESVGRWKSDEGQHDFDFLENELIEYGYSEPADRS